jgi:hypothetical protein
MTDRLTKTGRVPASTVDKWLRYHNREQRIEGNERELRAYPNDRGLKIANDKLKRQRDGWKVPEGWSSWKEIEKHMIATGQFTPLKTPVKEWHE